jgi:hypothetical protein
LGMLRRWGYYNGRPENAPFLSPVYICRAADILRYRLAWMRLSCVSDWNSISLYKCNYTILHESTNEWRTWD